VVVAFGDSITDGSNAGTGLDRGWPGGLARRLQAEAGPTKWRVINAGIGGNKLLADGMGTSGLSRFDRDALAVPGVSVVLLLEGINDLGGAAQALPLRAGLIAGYRAAIGEAHARGVRIIGATMTPFEGVDAGDYYTPAKDGVRRALNDWIRAGHGFDGVIDFDAALRDPEDPGRMQARYDSGDHLHPNAAGYQAMADAVDLGLLLRLR
jgi:lysophospholipase L1-like esterase